jgi:alcohol dehydrogenase, propanol-preferring
MRDVPVPDPGPGQALVRVAAAGVCHSDLHIMEPPRRRLALAAAVDARPRERRLGGGDRRRGDGLELGGTRWPSTSAGAAVGRCRLSAENECERLAEVGSRGGGLGRDGGRAERNWRPKRLVPLEFEDLEAVGRCYDSRE